MDRNSPVRQLFDVPIEAQVVEIVPQTWHNAIALRVELIGCNPLKTTLQPFTTTEKPKYCDDEMGVNNGNMSPSQYSVSSEFGPEHSKHHLKLDDHSAWQPLTNSPMEFVEFDFLEPRNLTGLVTKGGPDGWVTGFKVQYSPNGKDWNPVVDELGNEKVFLGNFDNDSPRTNEFDLPISAQVLKIIPVKWHDNVQMRVEPKGCYLPYRKLQSKFWGFVTWLIFS